MAELVSKLKELAKSRPSFYDKLNYFRRLMRFREGRLYSFLDAYSQSKGRDVSFVQIGANDGLRNDPVREFVVRDHWHGILVEPLPEAFQMLVNNYRYLKNDDLIFENCAIHSSTENALEIFTYSDEYLRGLPDDKRLSLLRKTSFDRAHVEKFLRVGSCHQVKKIKVDCFSILDLLEKHDITPSHLDLLIIDAEGHEFNILNSINYSAVKPAVIVFESNHLGTKQTELFSMLESVGYVITTYWPDSVASIGNATILMKEMCRDSDDR